MVYSTWDEELCGTDAVEIFRTLALWEVAAISDAGIRDFVTDALINWDLRSLVDMSIDYTSISLDDARHLRQALAFFQKRKDIEVGYDKQSIAEEKFWQSEKLCLETNNIFKLRARGEFQFLPRHERVLWHAARKVSSILGDIPCLKDLKLRFGPGATTQIQRRNASARAKLGQDHACSFELFPLATYVAAEMPLFTAISRDSEGATPFVLHDGKVAFVPKSAKEFRTVMVEPSLNTMCQAGIGSYMAARLRRAGIDIRSQEHNRSAARKGSQDGSLATVDLSSASDTVSIELVYDLLGVDWASYLGHFRTGSARIGSGQPFRLQKFSSMGNGFTFPLETLIFYSIAYGVCRELDIGTKEVLAYGDDIIVPSAAVPLLMQCLLAFGFQPNMSKSYSGGPFRESCGADYYQGIDIRPVYLKDKPRVLDLFRIHNAYYRRGEREACEYILSYIAPHLRLYGPDGYGDGHLLGEWVPAFKKKHLQRGYGGCIFRTFTLKPRQSFWPSRGDRVLPAYSTYVRESTSETSAVTQWRGENFAVAVPGTFGCNLISIYTLNRN